MAQEVTVRLTDDVDGTSTATETIEFGLDGATYNIDLSENNAAALREDFTKWVKHARKADAKTQSRKGDGQPRPRRRRTSPGESQAIRDWAAAQGIPLSPRGRIPEHVVASYHRRPAA